MAEVYGQRRAPQALGTAPADHLHRAAGLPRLIILAVVDRFGASYAERVISDRVAEQVANQDATSEKPDVTVEGVPFLTQVVKGEYQEIKIELRNFSGPAGNGKTIRMPLLDVRAKDVRAPLDTLRTRQGDIIATTVTGTGTVDYATLGRADRPGGREARREGRQAGGHRAARGAQPDRHDQRHGEPDGRRGQRGPDAFRRGARPRACRTSRWCSNVLNNYAKQISVDLKVPDLPLKMVVQKVQPTAAGLVVTAGAERGAAERRRSGPV